jgi:hypothetical protein
LISILTNIDISVKSGFISEPGLMLGAMSEVGLVVRLHKLGLLPEANRKTFVKTITEYAVEGQDLTAMSSKSSAACSRMRNLRR